MTRFRVSPAAKADLIAAVADLAAQTKAEWLAVGDNMVHAVERFAEQVAAGQGNACFEEGRDGAIMVFGVIVHDGVAHFWIVPTQRYFDLGVAGVLATRRALRAIAASRPEPLRVVTYAPERVPARRWLLKLGFRQIAEDGEKMMFDFIRHPRRRALLSPKPRTPGSRPAVRA